MREMYGGWEDSDPIDDALTTSFIVLSGSSTTVVAQNIYDVTTKQQQLDTTQSYIESLNKEELQDLSNKLDLILNGEEKSNEEQDKVKLLNK